MKNCLFLLILFLTFHLSTHAQTPLFKSKIFIDKDHHQIQAYIYPTKMDKIKPKKNRFYHYFYHKEIHQTQGDFSGYLLHGDYQVTNDSHQLIQKGQFKNGIKTGEWKEWQGNGTLSATSKWKNGRLHGQMEVFDQNGHLSNTRRYRRGKAKGEITIFQNGKKIKTPKEEKTKEKKAKREKGDKKSTKKESVK